MKRLPILLAAFITGLIAANPASANHVTTAVLELLNPDSSQETTAAKRAQTFAIDDDPVTTAFLKSVAAGNMPAREGLTLALERAYATGSTGVKVLNEAAQSAGDPATRAYAKAALRAIDPAQK